jgi:hypothetical protein
LISALNPVSGKAAFISPSAATIGVFCKFVHICCENCSEVFRISASREHPEMSLVSYRFDLRKCHGPPLLRGSEKACPYIAVHARAPPSIGHGDSGQA